MKKEIINIIETADNTVLSVESFILPDDKIKKFGKAVEEAEKCFIDKARENGIAEDEEQGALDDGYYKNGDYVIYLTWSNKVNQN